MSQQAVMDAESVSLGLLRRYLVAHGWRREADGGTSAYDTTLVDNNAVLNAFQTLRSGGRRNFDLYFLSENGAEHVEIVLPREQSASDLVPRVEGAIQTLSDVEGRTPAEIIAAVRMVGYDVVRSRIPNLLVHDDAVYLEIASSYITAVKDLLAATATTEMEPQPYFLRVKKEAKEYANQCRFGHTFRGSFGFTIESPLAPNVEPTLPQIAPLPPFERRVVERFARGVQSVCEAVKSTDLATLVANANMGFGANACEQFADLIETTSPGGLDFSFSFSPEWMAPAEFIEPKEFSVGAVHVEVSRAAAKLMRTQFIPRSEYIVGRVVRLESDSDPSNLLNPAGRREIMIQWLSEDLGEVLVKVPLDPEDYLRAVDAHAGGRVVTVAGTLEKRGRSWVLANPTHLLVQEKSGSENLDVS